MGMHFRMSCTPNQPLTVRSTQLISIPIASAAALFQLLDQSDGYTSWQCRCRDTQPLSKRWRNAQCGFREELDIHEPGNFPLA
jgi:hypothetical protein